MRVMTRRVPFLLCALLIALLWPAKAWADATAFWGLSYTPTTRTAKGFAVGVTLIVFGFEYEYSHTSEDEPQAAPGLVSHMGNILIQTPTGRAQLYFTAGGGFYQETYRDVRDERLRDEPRRRTEVHDRGSAAGAAWTIASSRCTASRSTAIPRGSTQGR